jgi:hypothetical protein
MWYDKTEETTVLTTTATLGSEVKLTIPRHKDFRLEGIHISLYFSCTPSAAPTYTGDKLQASLKNVELKINTTERGPHSPYFMHGPVLSEYTRQEIGTLDQQMLAFYNATPQHGGATACELNYYLPIRALALGDPVGQFTSIPLYMLKQDPELIIRLATAAEIATNFALTGATTITIVVRADMRDVSNDPQNREMFWPVDLISQDMTLTGNKFEIPNDGLITKMLLVGYSSATARDTLIGLPANTDRWKVLEGQRLWRDLAPLQGFALNGLSTANYPTWTTAPVGVLCFDFVWDIMGGDSCSLLSALDANPVIPPGGSTALPRRLRLEPSTAPAGSKTWKIAIQRIRITKAEIAKIPV